MGEGGKSFGRFASSGKVRSLERIRERGNRKEGRPSLQREKNSRVQ